MPAAGDGVVKNAVFFLHGRHKTVAVLLLVHGLVFFAMENKEEARCEVLTLCVLYWKIGQHAIDEK